MAGLIWLFHTRDKSREEGRKRQDLCFDSCPFHTGHCYCSAWLCCSKCVISALCRLMSASNIHMWGSESKWASERWRDARKQRYQRRASKTISGVSWVICNPAFFRLQRAAARWNTASGRVRGVVVGGWCVGMNLWRGGGGSDFSNKCWHEARLILDSGNSLICYGLWKSWDVLQGGWALPRPEPERPALSPSSVQL